jgi:hypothetical protein
VPVSAFASSASPKSAPATAQRLCTIPSSTRQAHPAGGGLAEERGKTTGRVLRSRARASPNARRTAWACAAWCRRSPTPSNSKCSASTRPTSSTRQGDGR